MEPWRDRNRRPVGVQGPQAGVKGFPVLLDPIRKQLTQGVTPAALALSMALGLGLGTFPVLGSTTLLCAAAAALLRLNQPAIQLVNYVAYPLQLLLLIPLLRAGAALLGASSGALTLAALRDQIGADPWGAIRLYGQATAGAVIVWAVIAIPAMILLARLFRPLVARLPVLKEKRGDAA
jgi:uncharacterized protein (DUF2062 family)